MAKAELGMTIFRLLTIAVLAWPSLAPRALARPSEIRSGVVSKSADWSAGLQFGNAGATGISAQRAGFVNGALNLVLGLDNGAAVASAEWIALFDEEFQRIPLQNRGGYQAIRDQLNPFIGAGLQVKDGLSLRLPVGMQYTMAQKPANFYGGLTLLLGRFLSDDSLGLSVGFHLGARILL